MAFFISSSPHQQHRKSTKEFFYSRSILEDAIDVVKAENVNCQEEINFSVWNTHFFVVDTVPDITEFSCRHNDLGL